MIHPRSSPDSDSDIFYLFSHYQIPIKSGRVIRRGGREFASPLASRATKKRRRVAGFIETVYLSSTGACSGRLVHSNGFLLALPSLSPLRQIARSRSLMALSNVRYASAFRSESSYRWSTALSQAPTSSIYFVIY